VAAGEVAWSGHAAAAATYLLHSGDAPEVGASGLHLRQRALLRRQGVLGGAQRGGGGLQRLLGLAMLLCHLLHLRLCDAGAGCGERRPVADH
jgi:hypothetical protein